MTVPTGVLAAIPPVVQTGQAIGSGIKGARSANELATRQSQLESTLGNVVNQGMGVYQSLLDSLAGFADDSLRNQLLSSGVDAAGQLRDLLTTGSQYFTSPAQYAPAIEGILGQSGINNLMGSLQALGGLTPPNLPNMQFGVTPSALQFGVNLPDTQFGATPSALQFGAILPDMQFGATPSALQFGVNLPDMQFGVTPNALQFGVNLPDMQFGVTPSALQFGVNLPDIDFSSIPGPVAQPGQQFQAPAVTGFNFSPIQQLQQQAMQNALQFAEGQRATAAENAAMGFQRAGDAVNRMLAQRGIGPTSGVGAAVIRDIALAQGQNMAELNRGLAEQAAQMGMQAGQFDVTSGLQLNQLMSGHDLARQQLAQDVAARQFGLNQAANQQLFEQQLAAGQFGREGQQLAATYALGRGGLALQGQGLGLQQALANMDTALRDRQLAANYALGRGGLALQGQGLGLQQALANTDAALRAQQLAANYGLGRGGLALQGQGLDLQQALANMDTALRAQQLAANYGLGRGGLTLQGQGLDLQQALANMDAALRAQQLSANYDLGRGGLALQGQGLGLQQALANMDAALRAQQLASGHALGLGGLQQQYNQLLGALAGQGAQFDLNRAGQLAGLQGLLDNRVMTGLGLLSQGITAPIDLLQGLYTQNVLNPQLGMAQLANPMGLIGAALGGLQNMMGLRQEQVSQAGRGKGAATGGAMSGLQSGVKGGGG